MGWCTCKARRDGADAEGPKAPGPLSGSDRYKARTRDGGLCLKTASSSPPLLAPATWAEEAMWFGETAGEQAGPNTKRTVNNSGRAVAHLRNGVARRRQRQRRSGEIPGLRRRSWVDLQGRRRRRPRVFAEKPAEPLWREGGGAESIRMTPRRPDIGANVGPRATPSRPHIGPTPTHAWLRGVPKSTPSRPKISRCHHGDA